MAAQILFTPHSIEKPRCFRGSNSFDHWTDNELRKIYRFGRNGIEYPASLLKDDLERPTQRNRAVTVKMQMLIALQFYASGSFLQVIRDTLGILDLYNSFNYLLLL